VPTEGTSTRNAAISAVFIIQTGHHTWDNRPMRVLLGSGGFRLPERIASLRAQMRDFFGDVDHLLFVPYAQANHDTYLASWRERGLDGGYPMSGIHEAPDPVAAVRAARGLVVGGGNTFRLLATLYDRGLIDVIRERVRGGMPYLGISAGCNVACPTIRTTNDMPIVDPGGLDALGLIPFQINPHYLSVALPGHHGETRDERLEEFTLANPGLRVLGLPEGNWVRVSGESAQLGGPHPSIWFEDGRRFSATAGQFSVLGGRGKQR
jgi:dipeptidase E